MQQHTYRTKDFQEAAVLICSGLSIAGLHKNGSVWFEFADRQRAEALCESYWRGDLSLPAKRFSAALKESKDLIFRTIRNENGEDAAHVVRSVLHK